MSKKATALEHLTSIASYETGMRGISMTDIYDLVADPQRPAPTVLDVMQALRFDPAQLHPAGETAFTPPTTGMIPAEAYDFFPDQTNADDETKIATSQFLQRFHLTSSAPPLTDFSQPAIAVPLPALLTAPSAIAYPEFHNIFNQPRLIVHSARWRLASVMALVYRSKHSQPLQLQTHRSVYTQTGVATEFSDDGTLVAVNLHTILSTEDPSQPRLNRPIVIDPID